MKVQQIHNFNKILAISSGIAADIKGAELGADNIYQAVQALYHNPNFTKIYYNTSEETKLKVIPILNNFFKNLIEEVTLQHKKYDKYLFFTGDHSNGIAVFSLISNLLQQITKESTDITRNKDLGLLWIDAHLDCHTPQSSHSKNVHGMPIAHLLGYGDKSLNSLINNKIKPQNLCYIATRSYEQEELDLITKLGVKVFFMKDITEANIKHIFKDAIAYISKNTIRFGVSLDIDALSRDEMPATGCNTGKGLTMKMLVENLESIKLHEKLLCIEITEFNPLLDTSNQQTYHNIMKLVKILLN